MKYEEFAQIYFVAPELYQVSWLQGKIYLEKNIQLIDKISKIKADNVSKHRRAFFVNKQNKFQTIMEINNDAEDFEIPQANLLALKHKRHTYIKIVAREMVFATCAAEIAKGNSGYLSFKDLDLDYVRKAIRDDFENNRMLIMKCLASRESNEKSYKKELRMHRRRFQQVRRFFFRKGSNSATIDEIVDFIMMQEPFMFEEFDRS